MSEERKLNEKELNEEELDEVVGGLEIGETVMFPMKILLYSHKNPFINKEMIGKISTTRPVYLEGSSPEGTKIRLKDCCDLEFTWSCYYAPHGDCGSAFYYAVLTEEQLQKFPIRYRESKIVESRITRLT